MSLSPTARADSLVTFVFSYLSLLGSILVLISYAVARSKSTPRIANLILHLAASDFFWFLSAGIQSTYWLFSSNNAVPTDACFVLSPLMIFTRMASLAWTCVISFNVLMSVEKRKWLWQGGDQSYLQYHQRYYAAIFLLAAPGTVLTLIKQHTSKDTSDLGCSPNYEALGVWYEVFFPEVLPIMLGFLCNVYVFLKVYGKISKSAYPQSVRKRRKRIMYHYIIVCIICWVPTVLNYMVELIGYHNTVIEILARACLYSSGFLNFLVFGMQDPHLKRSFKLLLYYSGLSSLCLFCLPTSSFLYYYSPLKATDVEKNVMFQEETILSNADLSKDKRSVYRNRKLSKADRLSLYAERPDLDLRSPTAADGSPLPVPAKSAMKGSRAAVADAGSPSRHGEKDAVSKEELAASLFQSHVQAGTLVIGATSPGGGDSTENLPVAGRVRSNSRSRSSSFHSGVSDGKYDLLAPLLTADDKPQRRSPSPAAPASVSSSYPQSSHEDKSGAKSVAGIFGFKDAGKSGARFQHAPSAAHGGGPPMPMDVVSAGFRSSSTERLIVQGSGGAPLDDVEHGGAVSDRELLLLHGGEKDWEARRHLEEDMNSADADLSSSDDDSDEEDKELSIPITAL